MPIAPLVGRLRLRHLALLSALGEMPTLHQAAAYLKVTQPSATKMLADIEHAFGFALFERHARGMRATALGSEVIGFARQTEGALERFMESLEQKRRGGHGHLVFGAVMGAAPDLVASAVAAIKRERPRLNVRLLGETSDQIGILLERQEIELAVGRYSATMQHNRFDFVPLANETLQLVVRRRHPLLKRRGLRLAHLIDWPWVLQPMTVPSRTLLEEELALAGLATPPDVVECTSIFASLQLLQSSDAIAMLPESVTRDYVSTGLLKPLPLALGQDLSAFGVLTRKGETLSEAAACFVQHLHQRAAAGAAATRKKSA
jgi:DNA-binding transcriptional LysR family regulator